MTEYPYGMSTFENVDKAPKPSLVKRAIALLILVAVVVLAAKLLIGFVMAVFWIIVGVAAVVAVLWALKTLL